ncbi:hypothetical protein D3C83_122300 [compost metagenome]
MDLAEGVVHHLPEHLREPVRERGERTDDRDREERVVEVREHEVRVVEVDVRAARAQEDSRHAADEELGDERQRPEHRRVQRDRAAV